MADLFRIDGGPHLTGSFVPGPRDSHVTKRPWKHNVRMITQCDSFYKWSLSYCVLVLVIIGILLFCIIYIILNTKSQFIIKRIFI